jgi:hypothetical protein
VNERRFALTISQINLRSLAPSSYYVPFGRPERHRKAPLSLKTITLTHFLNHASLPSPQWHARASNPSVFPSPIPKQSP